MYGQPAQQEPWWKRGARWIGGRILGGGGGGGGGPSGGPGYDPFINRSTPGAPGVTGPQMGGPGGQGAPNLGGRILGWAEKNPELAGTVVGAGLSIYGARQEGKLEDRRMDQDEEDRERRYREEERIRAARRDAFARIQARRGGA